MTIRTPFSIAIVLMVMVCLTVEAESLRGSLRGNLLPDSPAVTFGLEDLVGIGLPPGSRFTKGLEIEITIPREAFPYRSSFAVFVYQNFVPGKGKEGATGDRISLEVLPAMGKFYLQAPLVAKAGFTASVDTAVLKTVTFDKAFPLGLTILPIDKEVPADVAKLQFQVKTRLINSNLGAVNVLTPDLKPEERKQLRILANGVLQAAEGLILLEPGLYKIEATLAGHDAAQTTVAVGQAKVTDITFDLGPSLPTVTFEAPEGSLVVLDGKKLAWTPLTAFPIEIGPHSVQLSLGNTLVTEAFEISSGGNYKIRLNMHLSVEKQ